MQEWGCSSQGAALAGPGQPAWGGSGIALGIRREQHRRSGHRPRGRGEGRRTASTLPDTRALEPIHQALERRRLLPARHYLDSGYPSAELIVGSAKAYGVALITPVLLDTSRQAKAQQGFADTDFTIDWDNQQAVCPAGKTSTTWNDVIQEGVAKTVVSFAALDCIPCPSKDQCTSARSNRRRLSLQPRELTEAIQAARARQQTGDFNRDYALRAGVGGTIRRATRRRTIRVNTPSGGSMLKV
ncbi:transposase [Streptomyces yanii]|uniref:Transposase n=1 Tax=Streptomyces yanii TaxID=78510 RepID=A0ABV5RPI7_9ACTN